MTVDATLPADGATADAIARAKAGELLGPTEVAAIFRIGHSRFHTLDRSGAFDHFKVRPAIGPKCFSGALLARYLAGEPLYVPTFGAKRPKRA